MTALAVSAAFLLTVSLAACSKSQTVQDLVSEAQRLHQKGDQKAAIIQLKNAIQEDSNNVEARYLLGTIYNETGDGQSAEKEIRRALSLGMNQTKAASALARALLSQGEFQKALDETVPPAGAKADAEILALRGNAYLALGKGREAKDTFELALKDKPDYPDALIGLARYALSENDMTNAMRFSEQATSKNPTSADAWFFHGDLARIQGKADAALAAYDQVLKLNPDSSTAYIAKATVEIGTGKLDAAKADIEAARKLAPKGLAVLYTQALLDSRQGKHAAALESLQQVLHAAPGHMPSLLLAGAVNLALGSSGQAEQHLRKYLDRNPQNLYARKLLATALLKNREPQHAIDVLAPALKDSREDAQLLALAGEAYMQTRNFALATEYFEKASTLVPQAAQLHTALGLSKLGAGEDTRAIAELEKAVSLDTKSPKAGVLLIMAQLQRKEYDKALSAAKALEKEQPDNPMVQNLKGGVHLGKKDIPAARASFEKAVALQPGYFPAIANLAQLDVLEKKPEAAKKRFEEVLAKDKKNIQAMTALAGLALSQGQAKDATSWLERASNENPEALQPAIQLAGHYLRIGEKQKALTLARKLQAANSGNLSVLDLLGQAQLANDDKAGALESYGKLATAMPTSAPVQLRIAAIHMAMNNQQGASEALKKALDLQPDYKDAQVAQASLEAGKGNLEQSLAIARTIQKQHGKSPVGFALEGDVLMAQKKAVLAVKSYEQALAMNKNGPLMVKLHASLVQSGKSKEAGSRLTQWLKEHPDDASTRMYLAGSYLAEKQNKAAIEQYEILVKQHPKYVPALNNLAWLYYLEKDSRALEHAEKANALVSDNPMTLDTLGWILVEQGNTKRGLPLLEKAFTLAPEAMDIHFHLAQGLVKSGDKARARKELEQLLASKKPFAKSDEVRALLKEL